jgi:hypothetical protein
VLGIIILALGVVALLNGLNITDLSLGKVIADYWPLLLIAWGIGFLMERTGPGGRVIGAIVFLLGIGFLGRNLGWFDFDPRYAWNLFWPLVLILLGVSFLFGFHRHDGRSTTAIMGGIERKDTWNLESASFLAFMGGIHLDMRQAIIPDQVITINVTTFMGGVDIVVPSDLAVVCEGSAVLGGVDFFGKGSGGIVGGLRAEQGDIKGKKVLRINCFSALGGVNVKAAAMGEKINW